MTQLARSTCGLSLHWYGQALAGWDQKKNSQSKRMQTLGKEPCRAKSTLTDTNITWTDKLISITLHCKINSTTTHSTVDLSLNPLHQQKKKYFFFGCFTHLQANPSSSRHINCIRHLFCLCESFCLSLGKSFLFMALIIPSVTCARQNNH